MGTTVSSPTGGLGRGLSAILPGSAPERLDSLRAQFVDTALSSLVAGGARQLCGYVHHDGDQVEVTLRLPDPVGLHPVLAYQLFAPLGAIAALGGRHQFRIAGSDALAVVTVTPRSRGIFFFGDPELPPEGRDRLASFCEVFAPVIHDHDRPADEGEELHLTLDQKGGDAHAEVTVGSQVGFGSGPRAQVAVARAALASVSADAELVEVGEARHSDGSAAFVVAAGKKGRMRAGAAPVVAGQDAAAGLAALRAGRALER